MSRSMSLVDARSKDWSEFTLEGVFAQNNFDEFPGLDGASYSWNSLVSYHSREGGNPFFSN